MCLMSMSQSSDSKIYSSAAEFQAVFEQSAVGLSRIGFDSGRWLDVNTAFCRMLGRSRDDVLRRTWMEITHPADLDDGLTAAKRMLDGTVESATLEKRYFPC
jgi:PAS domain S-box-containing protein